MKKLIYSSFVALIASAFLTSCGGDDGNGGGTTTTPKGPSIEFQTNTGTFSGYTFADGSAETETTIKIGVKLTSTVNLKSTKMTVKFNNQAEQLVMTDSTIGGNTKTFTRDYTFAIPADAGTYVFTAYATDKDATTSSAKITIIASGKLLDRTDGVFYSLKATGADRFSAFDFFSGEAITAATGAGNEAMRDAVDQSTSSTLSKSWKTQNGTQFVISGTDGKLNNKVFNQIKTTQDLIAAWDATSGKSETVSGIEIGKMIIAKSVRSGKTYYYLIALTEVADESGSEDDRYEFQMKQSNN
ncbi:MAG TPA: hypothetical protein VGF79_07090 [Bacteroidia bacterium]